MKLAEGAKSLSEKRENEIGKMPPSHRKAAQRQSLEEARTYVMTYDVVQKRLVMNESSDRFVHDIWEGSDTRPDV